MLGYSKSKVYVDNYLTIDELQIFKCVWTSNEKPNKKNNLFMYCIIKNEKKGKKGLKLY